jgi:DNA modification methylase
MAGHARLAACAELGWKDIPALRIEDLSPAETRAYSIADNRLAENARWNDRLLGEVFAELSELELDFSLEVTGFSGPEIDLRIESISQETRPSDLDDEAIPDIGPEITRLGDCWLLGRHRLMCGDSLLGESYTRLMNREKAQVVFSDAPYNVKIDGHATGNGKVHHREFVMASGEKTSEEFEAFLTTVFRHLIAHTTDGSIHYQCMDWRHQGEIINAARGVYQELKNLCVWVKNAPGMGSFYRSQHELVFVFKSGTGKHRNNVELGRHGRSRSNVWNYNGANTFSRTSDEGNLLAIHPTVKPVALIADALLDCSVRGGIVLDPFCGIGSTIIAAERTGRICHGIEIDPLYVDAAIRRWQRYTGDTAKHAETGQPFGFATPGGDHG